jgi:non-ribosomal peptide synthetase component F
MRTVYSDVPEPVATPAVEPPACSHHRFEAQAARTPHAIALSFEGREWTYRELNRRANRLAHRLRALGVGPDVRVAVALERSPEMLAAVLGVLKAGGAYVPVDPAYPPDRVAAMIVDAQPAVVLTDTAPAVLPVGAQTLEVARALERGAEEDPEPLAGPGDLAYVIYTSGSTGRPKGVQVPHGALANFLSSMAAEPGLTHDDVVLAVTTLSFDIAALELFLPLVVGARAADERHRAAGDAVDVADGARCRLAGRSAVEGPVRR